MNLQLGKDGGNVISKEFLHMNAITQYIKERWETEMQQEISMEDWKEIYSEAHTMTNANIWRQYKWNVIARYLRAPQITTKMGQRANAGEIVQHILAIILTYSGHT